MANSFHRVHRSLGADRGIGSLVALATGLVLLGAWLAWAFCARLPRYESSDSARLQFASSAGPQVVAQFQPAALDTLRPGQSAIVRFPDFRPSQYGTVPAQVRRVADEIRNGRIEVVLVVSSPIAGHIPFRNGLSGSVEVEVERISPAALIFRSAGALMGSR